MKTTCLVYRDAFNPSGISTEYPFRFCSLDFSPFSSWSSGLTNEQQAIPLDIYSKMLLSGSQMRNLSFMSASETPVVALES